MRPLLSLLLLTLPAATTPAQDDQTQIQIKTLLDKYTTSINRADTTLAAEVWSTTPDVSLIHPMGHERGWTQIKDNFYTAVLAKMFSHRDLKTKDLTIHVLGDSAWLEFNWEFTATLAATNQQMNSKGRESQFLKKTPKAGASSTSTIPSRSLPPLKASNRTLFFSLSLPRCARVSRPRTTRPAARQEIAPSLRLPVTHAAMQNFVIRGAAIPPTDSRPN